MKGNAKLIFVWLIGLAVIAWAVFNIVADKKREFKLESRPLSENLIFDYAGVLSDYKEYLNRYLQGFLDSFSIEIVVVSIKNTPKTESIEKMAYNILNNWKIGKDSNGRGILLLLLKDRKEVKLEVSMELEDVFTDAFTGFIEDIQLKPYFLNDQIDVGLISVLHELEMRAEIKNQKDCTAEHIDKLDMEILSIGAGAKRKLPDYKEEKILFARTVKYGAGKTPEQAWQNLLKSWHDKVRDPQLGVYTDIAKISYKDYTNRTDSSFERDYKTWGKRPYEVIKNDKHAVIFFGNEKGWDNTPFFFAKTTEGWKFDLVNQRLWIRMGKAPYWGIEAADHPYMELTTKCPHYDGLDMPLEEKDIYRIKDDKKIAKRILELENEHLKKDNFETAMELGRLNTITARRPKHAFPILKKAMELNPDSPLPHKYMGIRLVTSTFQYESALDEIVKYIEMKPEDAYGYSFKGFLYLNMKKYNDAIKAFKRSIKLKPDNFYSLCKLSQTYAQMHLNAENLNPLKNSYKRNAVSYYKMAAIFQTENPERLTRLKQWLNSKGFNLK